MQNDKLLPCPFCGGEATIKWEAWKEISETSGVYRLTANHSRECFFKRMIGYDPNGEMISNDKEKLAEAWNTRKPMERIVETLQSELKSADKEKERCAKENPLQFDSAKGYSTGISNSLDIVRKGGVDNAE